MASTDKEAYEFVMSFIAASEKYRDQFVGKWEEVLQNFMVQPQDLSDYYDTPYARGYVWKSRRNQIVLKDPETHRLVMTYAAKLVRAIFGDPRHEYVQAVPVGYEDALKAQTVTKLMRYAFSRPGMFRSLVETVVDMLLFGTAVVEVGWEYREVEMSVRSVESQFGIETSTEQRLRMPAYNDVTLKPLDVTCFYPDPSRYRMSDMTGAAKEFTMTAIDAREMARKEVYSKRGVEQAISTGKPGGHAKSPSFRTTIDQPVKNNVSGFGEMIGYEYWGEVPFDNNGSSRSVVTILNGVVVRNDPFPFADPYLPFHAFTINPVQGRFYGISPAETARWDQSFADAIKILLAEAIIRQVHPPIAYDDGADIDVDALKAWKADTLIRARGGPNAVGALRYDANVQSGFAMLQGLKLDIQQSSGALGGISGDPGPDRESASAAVQRVQMAMDRPELAGMLLEQDPLPGVASAFLRRYQQFLVDTDDLKLRVGEMPESAWLGDIMGDFDIMFLGSRMATSRQSKLQAFDRIVSYAGVSPAFQVMLPNQEIAQYVIGELLELPEVATKIGDPRQVMINMLAMQAGGGGGGAAGNGVPTAAEPSGLAPAQAAGNLTSA